MSENEQIGVTPAKGRPMLSWVGKRPLAQVTAFPAQHVETFDPAGAADLRGVDLWAGWPDRYPRGGLLFHGDNKEVLANLLANGFRGRVKLIIIDPPFDSGADYVRRVRLRGVTGIAKIDGEGYTLGEQIQYTDIWVNDNYLQFMYERLLLLKELLAEDGSIYLQCDYRRVHQLRFLMDEVFGDNHLLNEVVYGYRIQGIAQNFWARKHQTLLFYRKGDTYTFNPEKERVFYNKPFIDTKRDDEGRYYNDVFVRDVWDCDYTKPFISGSSEYLGFPTQKSEGLLMRIIRASSNPGDLVLDCFIGSGTTASVAQKRGRRWIGCDINKGAIQTTSKRLQAIIQKQITVKAKNAQDKLVDSEDVPTEPAQLSFTIWRVNDYDLQIQHNEAVNLACEHIGIQRTRSDQFFDGVLGRDLAKIVPFNHPLSPLDLDEIQRELRARPDEDRNITVVCLGKELAADAWMEDWNRLRTGSNAVNRIKVIELRTDPRYGKFFEHKPALAKVSIARRDGQIHVEIENFISPTIIERLDQQAGILRPQIEDWRQMVDCVMIDPSFDGEVFQVALSDLPEKKGDFVAGTYALPAPDGSTVVAVKIIDMLCEEVLVTKRV